MIHNVIGIIVFLIVVFVGWQASKDPSTMFTCETIYKTISGGWTGKRVGHSTWGRGCEVRFEYDTFPDIEFQRRMRFVKFLEENLPCGDGLWQGIVVTKFGIMYQIHFPIKNGMENDETVTDLRFMANELSTKVFDSQPVDIHGCDTFFNTIRVVAQ